MRNSSDKGCRIPQRYILAFMTFLGIIVEYMMRNVLSIAITQIARRTVSEEQIISGERCPVDNSTLIDDDKPFVEGSYEWSEAVQGVILSSFYWGYIITHIPGGTLVEKFGGKVMLLGAVASTSVLTLLIPASIYFGDYTLLIINQVIMGLCQGVVYASFAGLLSLWIPLRERTTVGRFVLSAQQFGSMLATSLSGVLLQNISGWQWPFYIYSILGGIWCIFFAFFCSKDPQSNKYITSDEKNYLTREIGSLQRDENLPPTPYKAILTSLPVWAIIITQVGTEFLFFVKLIFLPKYFADVMGFDIQANGFYSALPKLLAFVGGIGFGLLSDFCINKKILSVGMTRKSFTATGYIVSSVCFIMASYSGCSRMSAILLFTLSSFIGSMSNYQVNNMDLSPNYAPTIISLANGLATATSIFTPIAVGLMTTNSTISEWRVVFWLSLGISDAAAIFYLIFADGKIQPWNNPNKQITSN